MEMRKCTNGHYYDASIYHDCPYCLGTGGSSGGRDDERTMPFLNSVEEDDSRTIPMAAAAPAKAAVEDDERTVAIVRQNTGIDPVVGWLVCVEGREKGRDYRIHTDNNYLGRSEKMDICVRGDDTISRENHVIISYDSADKIYYCSPGDGRSIVRLNDKAIFQTVELKPYDRIMVGKTVLLFLPLCGQEFEWKG